MNTNDFEPLQKPPGDLWEFIFTEHKKMFLSYLKVEGIDWDNHNFSLDCPEDQLMFKDYLQIRFTEELCEATLALKDNNNQSSEHFLEEMIDAFNFFIAAMILLGKTHNDLPRWGHMLNYDIRPMSDVMWRMVEQVGKLCNILKNRPWSQSNYLVDRKLFDETLIETWTTFNIMFNNLNISEEQIYKVWSQKLQVNMFRIESGY